MYKFDLPCIYSNTFKNYVLETSPEEQSSNLQLDCWKGAEQFNDILNTDINSLPNLEVCIFCKHLF